MTSKTLIRFLCALSILGALTGCPENPELPKWRMMKLEWNATAPPQVWTWMRPLNFAILFNDETYIECMGSRSARSKAFLCPPVQPPPRGDGNKAMCPTPEWDCACCKLKLVDHDGQPETDEVWDYDTQEVDDDNDPETPSVSQPICEQMD